MKKAVFPNGVSFSISDDQARKIRFIQDCFRKTSNYAAKSNS